VGISGFPGHHPVGPIPCAVPRRLEVLRGGRGSARRVHGGGEKHAHGWDYLAGLLICREAGAAEGEARRRGPGGRDASSAGHIVAADDGTAERLAAEGTL